MGWAGSPRQERFNRRLNVLTLVASGLMVLGLAPVGVVREKVAYVTAWLAVVFIIGPILVVARFTALGRITKRTSRVVVYVASVLVVALEAGVLTLLRR